MTCFRGWIGASRPVSEELEEQQRWCLLYQKSLKHIQEACPGGIISTVRQGSSCLNQGGICKGAGGMTPPNRGPGCLLGSERVASCEVQLYHLSIDIMVGKTGQDQRLNPHNFPLTPKSSHTGASKPRAPSQRLGGSLKSGNAFNSRVCCVWWVARMVCREETTFI